MFQMFTYALRAFFRRKLFNDHGLVFRQWLKGFLFTLALLLGFGYFFGPLTGIIVGSLIGGAAQPYLFKDVKYA